MAKFKVGDKARVTEDKASCSEFVKDEVVEIIDICDPGTEWEYYEARSETNGDWFITDDYLEAVEDNQG